MRSDRECHPRYFPHFESSVLLIHLPNEHLRSNTIRIIIHCVCTIALSVSDPITMPSNHALIDCDGRLMPVRVPASVPPSAPRQSRILPTRADTKLPVGISCSLRPLNPNDTFDLSPLYTPPSSLHQTPANVTLGQSIEHGSFRTFKRRSASTGSESEAIAPAKKILRTTNSFGLSFKPRSTSILCSEHKEEQRSGSSKKNESHVDRCLGQDGKLASKDVASASSIRFDAKRPLPSFVLYRAPRSMKYDSCSGEQAGVREKTLPENIPERILFPMF